jgi:hypothetical protein
VKSYEELRTICQRTSRISARVVDDFLINYAAGHQGLEKTMEKQFARFSHVGIKLGKKIVNMLKSQYLAHQVFRQDGLLGKFLKHPALGRFTGEERDYLFQQHKLAWRFSFSIIVDEPAADFYSMEDVFTGKRYLLYSPGVSDIRNHASPALWFNLLGFNGFCWQSYGPVVYYNGFETGDIWFFATELNHGLEEPGQVYDHVDRDLLPYMMLISGSALPLTFHKEDQLLYLLAEHDLDTLDTASLKSGFTTGYEKGVYRITPKKWGEPPHFAQAYYDEEKQLLLFSAMTRRGFGALVEAFNAFGFEYPAEPYLSVNMTMVSTAAGILKRKVVLNEYLELFQEESDPGKDKMIEDINAFIALVMPDINAGITPDIEAAARKTGVDPRTARDLVKSVMQSLEKLPAPGGKYTGSKTAGKMVSGRKAVSDKRVAATGIVPLQPKEGVRLLSPDDELLFGLHLYRMADEVRRGSPWNYLWEDELFGVQIPGTDLIYFVSVMGSDGAFPALSFYKGYSGLEGFLKFREELERRSRLGPASGDMFRAATMIGGVICIPHMMLSFTDREDLGKEDLAAIKKSGASFRGSGNWPQITEIVPGYLPVYPGRESLRDLSLVLKQVLVVMEKIGEDEDYLFREDDPDECYLVRIPTGKGPKFRWKDHYLVVDPEWGSPFYRYVTSNDDILAISRLPEASQVLQLDLILLPASIREKGQKGYFPFALLMVDKRNDMVISSSVLSPEPDLHSLYESLPQKVLKELRRIGHRPSAIEIRTDLLFLLLEETLENAGCRVKRVSEMPAMDGAISSLVSHLR